MDDDLLERATAALRETTKTPSPLPPTARARLLAEAAQLQTTSPGRKQRRPNTGPGRWLLPAFLVLGSGTALARVTYQYFPETWNALAPRAWERPLVAPVRPPSKSPRKPVNPTTPAAEPVLGPEPEAPEPEAPITEPVPEPVRPQKPTPVRKPQPTPPAKAPPSHPPTAAPPQTPSPGDAPDVLLFRRAMGLHNSQSPLALQAWDDFLRVAGQSPLVPEARYNRALALLRDRQYVQARQALEPFAEGTYGTFRRREARTLLDELNQRGHADSHER